MVPGPTGGSVASRGAWLAMADAAAPGATAVVEGAVVVLVLDMPFMPGMPAIAAAPVAEPAPLASAGGTTGAAGDLAGCPAAQIMRTASTARPGTRIATMIEPMLQPELGGGSREVTWWSVSRVSVAGVIGSPSAAGLPQGGPERPRPRRGSTARQSRETTRLVP